MRRSRPELRADAWLTEADVTWRSVDGRPLDPADWTGSDPALVMAYEDVVVALNPGVEDRELAVPNGTGWEVVVDTTTPDGAPAAPLDGPTCALPARSVLVLAR